MRKCTTAGYAGSSASERAGLAVVKEEFFHRLIELSPKGISDHLGWSSTWHRPFYFCQLHLYLSNLLSNSDLKVFNH